LIGQCEECKSKVRLQAKLTIGASDDPLEREADRIADQVLAAGADPTLGHMPPRIQRSAVSATEGMDAAPVSVDRVLASSGRLLEPALKQDMEERFGHDFSRVRVHSGAEAEKSARDVNAHAYTVGHNIVFASGQFAPGTQEGRQLIAHELAHVVQQGGSEANHNTYSIIDEHHVAEREAELAAQAVTNGKGAHIAIRSPAPKLYRHKDDIVAYSGGQSSALNIIQAGQLIYSAPAVSGHPGHGENEPSEGPIPAGKYVIHPNIVQPRVERSQAGTCGAAGIRTGYQEITSNDPTPCTGAHYCNVPCPTASNPGQVCFTPKDCWGPMRIKIEGSKAVVTPSGTRKIRDGFFIHGGNPVDAVTSGCVKSLDNGVFPEIRKLTGIKGAVPFCVGNACPPLVEAAISRKIVEEASAVVESIQEFLGF
jgi:hypothetical protein